MGAGTEKFLESEKKLKKYLGPGVLMYTFYLSSREADLCEFEANLVYRVSSRADRETVSQKTKREIKTKTIFFFFVI